MFPPAKNFPAAHGHTPPGEALWYFQCGSPQLQAIGADGLTGNPVRAP